MLTQKELKEVLKYDPETGLFTWIKQISNCIKIGDVAGGKNERGYTLIFIRNKKHYAHRLAWLYMEGYFPEHDIDHIDRNPSNNKWNNLRHVSHACNMKNSSKRKDNKSGVSRVYWYTPSNKWRSQIALNGKNIHLGLFKSLTKAVYHRWKAECKYNWTNCCTTSTSYLYLKEKGLIK